MDLFKNKNTTDSLRDRLEDLRQKNELWLKRFQEVRKIKAEAENLEIEKKYKKAIQKYLKVIEVSKNYGFHYNHYAYSIQRTIILYGKTKQLQTLKLYLEELLKKYSGARFENNWKVRLEKIKSKLNE